MSDEIRSYDELQKQIHEALRSQHPEWVDADGESPVCDSYEARLAELITLFTAQENRAAA
jgi:hypothetical protein